MTRKKCLTIATITAGAFGLGLLLLYLKMQESLKPQVDVSDELKVSVEEQEGKLPYSFTNSKGKQYFLHCKKVQNGRELYYFAHKLTSEFAIYDVPAGKKVIETPNGLPVLKNI